MQKRPFILSFICVLGIAGVCITFPGVFSPKIKKIGTFIPAIYGLIVAFNFISYIGVWYMKRWGAQLFYISYFSRIAFLISIDKFGGMHVLDVLFLLWYGITFLYFYRKFGVGL